MTTSVPLKVRCEDFLKDNRRVYARKAVRKKIAIVSVEATNLHTADLTLRLGSTELIAGGTSYRAESPAVIVRKLSEFTWDFLFYSIIDFHPINALIDAFFFLTGPLYNRRLRRQLKLLSDGELILKPGECKKALIAFRGVAGRADVVWLSIYRADGNKQQLQCSVD
jgi:hypothetical protein